MTERIIEIADTAAFLAYENNLLKIRLHEQDEVRMPVSEIACLVLANPAVTITGALLAELALAGVMVVVSGSNRMPVSMHLPLNGNYIQNERFRAQLAAGVPLKKRLWQTVIKEKIKQQGVLLQKTKGNDCNLLKLSSEVKSGDSENMEGRAAAVYWKNLFAKPFVRDRDERDNNVLLNYGYAILRAITARACCAAGLHPTLGINHHNRYNPYCLADDLMEPFRPVIDCKVASLNPDNSPIDELSKELRRELLSVFLEKIDTGKGRWHIGDLLKIYAGQVADSFVCGEHLLKFY